MALKGINVEDLPTDVLEEIFLFVRDRKVLRQVSRKFKEIVENSPKLMAKYAVNVLERCLYEPLKAPVYPSYQTLKFSDIQISFDEFQWINSYKNKERIRCIKINPTIEDDSNPKMFAAFLQSILFYFSSLQELFINLDNFWVENPSDYNLQLISSELSNLQKLTIVCGEERDISTVVNMFTLVQSIKSFSIHCNYFFDFYNGSKWKLEELNVWYYDLCKDVADLKQYKNFLTKQKNTLKKFRCDEDKLYDFVMMNLSDLETLHICIPSDDPVNNDFMVMNDKLKCLTISYFDGDNEKLENILGSCSNLERLMIKMGEEEQEIVAPIVGIKLSNLTHLWLDGLLSSVLLNIKMPNLKFLEISNSVNEDPYNFSRVPPENFKNLEKLSIANVWRMKEIYQVLLMCPKLIFLNLGFFKEFKGSLNASMINILLAHTHQLRYLGLLKYKNQTMTPEELQSQIHKKNIIVKFYDKFEALMKDYWKIGYVGTDCCGMDILI